jgi:alpha-ketoglutarate-dependent 2,4-dichlorophenoxyacetate dioxygenase
MISISARPLHPPHFFGKVAGIDFSRSLDAATAKEIIRLNNEYAVLVFPKTGLDDDGHVALSRLLGPLELAPKLFSKEHENRRRLKLPELFEAGNLNADGNIQAPDDRFRMFARGNRLWHTDSSFYQKRSKYSLLLAYAVPPDGGDTEFADMRAAYDALPATMKDRIENFVCEHDVWYSRELAGFPDATPEERGKMPPAHHRLVQVHPGSGRKTLLLASHASRIVDWPLSDGRALLDELMAFATQARFVHRHSWLVGDLVMWDNRCTMHRATEFDDMAEHRDMRRTTVIEDAA